jgi:PilZ domain
MRKWTEERRKAPRHPACHLARLFPANGGPVQYCIVTNMSEGGVRLSTNGFELPNEFVLKFADPCPGRDGTYKLIWRNGVYAGAQFIAAMVDDPKTPEVGREEELVG